MVLKLESVSDEVFCARPPSASEQAVLRAKFEEMLLKVFLFGTETFLLSSIDRHKTGGGREEQKGKSL